MPKRSFAPAPDQAAEALASVPSACWPSRTSHSATDTMTCADRFTRKPPQFLTPGQPGVMGSAVARRNGSLQSRGNEKVAGILEDQRDGDGSA